MEMSGTLVGIVGMGIGSIGYITAILATKRIKKLEHQLVDMKLSASKIISLEKQIADLKNVLPISGTE